MVILRYHLSFFVCFVLFFFFLGTRSDEIITSAFLFMKKHFRYFFLWKIYLFPYFEDVLYLPSPPSPPILTVKTIESDLPRNRTRLSFPLTGSDLQKSGPINLKRVRILYRARFNKNSSPISFEIRSETYRTRLENGPDLLSCSIKRNRIRVDIRVQLKNIELDYPETGKHPLTVGSSQWDER